ncbi:hypothetical protein ACSAZK_17900 [Methanosarcina sp. Mfa9]|uniref:hypothetical protein n=1 Tax=Methanosarcina sp. Mfa9 TaxID=3439063 RepID=UPI003F83075A
MDMESTLKYHLPGLGQLKAELYLNSLQAYKLIKEKSHVQRLKEIDQLGVIRNVYEGVHHSRWEYVMVQLGILHQLNVIDLDTGCKPSKGMGLNSKVTINSRNTSYVEIIQMWIMLLNMGHLPGTFSSEKALLKCLKGDYTLQKSLKDGLPNKEVKSYFFKIIAEENIYDLHKVLSFFYLSRYKRYNPELIEYLVKVLELYCIDYPVIDKYDEFDIVRKKSIEITLNKNKQIFNKIRQISYLYLDSKYGPTPFNFDLECILINLSEYVDKLFLDNGNHIAQSINDFDKFLSSTIYQSEDSLQAQGFHVKRVAENIKKMCKDDEIYGINKFFKFLYRNDNFNYKYNYTDYLDLDSQIKFSICAKNPNLLELWGQENYDRMYPNKLKNILNFKYEDKLNLDYGIKKCIFSVEPSIKKENYNIAFSFFKGCKDPQRFEILGKLIKDLVSLENEIQTSNSGGQEGTFRLIYKDLFLYLLKQISENKCIFKFDNYTTLDVPCIGNVGSTSAANSLKKMIENFENIEEIGKSRMHEVGSLEKSLREIEHRGPIIVCSNQIKVQTYDRNDLTDIDGIGFGYKNGNLHLLLVEAKKMKLRPLKESRDQLITNLKDKLKVNTSAINSLDEYIINLDKSVCCYLPVDGKLFND